MSETEGESTEEITTALKEVLQFLDILTPPDYKNQVLDHVLGMTGTSSGAQAISTNEGLLTVVKKLILFDENATTRLNALKIVVNVTSTNADNRLLFNYFMEAEFLKVLLRVVTDASSECSDLVAMLLNNLTQEKQNAETVLAILKKTQSESFEKFVNAFCVEGYNEKGCHLHHLGSFMANLTALKQARDVLLQPLEDQDFSCLLHRLFPFTQYEKSVDRRLAVARIIRNCLLDTSCHDLVVSDDVDIIPHLLLPLAGPEEFCSEENDLLHIDLQYLPPTKRREKNPRVIILICETLFQLCATIDCRMKMKSNGTYYILRELHKSLDANSIALETLEHAIQILIQDEPEDEGHASNLRNVEIPEDIQRKLDMLKDAVEE